MKYLFEISGCLKVKAIDDYEAELNKTLREFGMNQQVHFAGPISNCTVESDKPLSLEDLEMIKEKIKEVYEPHVNHLVIKYKNA